MRQGHFRRRRALCGLGSDRLRPLGGRIGTGADNAGLLAATALAEQPIGCALLCSKSLRQRLAAPLLVALGLGDRTR